jgi:hypothetical protein
MQGKNLELWQKLCEQAAVEQDPKRLLELVKEIDRILGEKQDRLNRNTIQRPQDSSSEPESAG